MLCSKHIYITQSFKIPTKYNHLYTFNKILLIYALADSHLLTINIMEIFPADYSAAIQGVIKIVKNKKIYIIPYLNVGVLTHCAMIVMDH